MINTTARPRIRRPACVWVLLAGVLLLGRPVLPPACAQGADPAAELAQVREKADKGDLESLNVLGNVYTNALLGQKQDFGEALAWYQRAAEKGFAPAQFNLGLAYELGRGVAADERQAFKHYLMAAEQGFAAAQFNVGNMYSTGRGVGQDLFEANLWYKQAAEKGVVEAQFNLGLAYEAGRGVKKDEVQAARWYKQAADRGFARAQYNLGLLLEDGRGVAKNEAGAAAFYRAAAEQGFAAAQNNYGLMISEGRGGLTKDPVQAYFWLSLAAANGTNPAARDFVAKSLTAEQLAAAQKLLGDNQAGKPLPAAAPTQTAARPASAPVPVSPAPTPENSGAAARVAELTAALEKAAQANTRFAEANQKLELEKARLQQALDSPASGSDSPGLVEQLRGQNRRLSDQLQSLLVDKDTAERNAKILAAQVKDAQEEVTRLKSAPAPVAAEPSPGSDAAQYSAEITGLNEKLQKATTALGLLQQTQQDLTDANARLQKERDTLAAAAKTPGAGADPNKYPVQESDKDAIIANLKRDNARLDGEVKSSIRELMLVNAQIRNQRRDATDTSGAAGPADNSANQQESARLQAENSRLAARVAGLEQQAQAVPDNSLAPKLAEARQAVAQLQEQVKSLQGEKADLEKWSQSLEKTLNEKSAATPAAGPEVAELHARLAKAEQEVADRAALIVEQGQMMEKLTAEKNAYAERSRQAEAALAAKTAAKPAPDETGPLRQQLAEATDRAEQATREKQTLTEQAAAEHSSYLRSQARVATLETDLRTARQKPAVADTTALDDLRKQLAEATDGLARTTIEKKSLAEKVAAEHSSYLDAQARVAALEDDLRSARQKPAAVDNSASDDLKKQLADANSALEKSGVAVAELTAANDKLTKQAAAADGTQRELAAANGQLAEVRQQLAAAKQPGAEITALREENGRLRSSAAEAATLKAKADQLARDNDQLAGFMNSNRRDLNQAQARVTELEKQLEEATTIRTRGGDDTAKLQADLAGANQSIEKLNTTVAELTSTNDRLEKDLDNAKKSTAAALAAQSQAVSAAQPDAYKMEIGTLQARVKELEGQIEDERGNAAKAVATIADQLTRTRDTNKALTEANRALLNAKQSETPTVDKDDFDRLQAKVRDLTALGEDARQQNQKLADDNDRLTTEQATLKQQLEDARKAATVVPGLADEKAALQERLEAVGAQLMKSQQEVDTLQKENADATSQQLASRQAADKAAADLAALQAHAAEADKAAEAHNTSVAQLTEANGKLETERNDLQRQLAALKADNTRLTQTAGSLEQMKADADRSAQQNIDSLTAQLAQTRRDLQSARDANARLVEGNVAQDRDRAATITLLQQQNAALAARLTQAQGTLDQIASAARLGTPAAAIAAGNPAPIPTVSTAPAGAGARYHTVAEGDSLSRISMRYYGTPNRWQEIYNANRDVLQGSSTLRVGMQLRIP